MKSTLMILAAFMLVFGACAVKLKTPTQADADRGAVMFSGYSLDQLNEGKQLYEQYCGQCHKLKRIKSESASNWKKIMPNMVKAVNKKTKATTITPDKEELLLRYVLTMGRK